MLVPPQDAEAAKTKKVRLRVGRGKVSGQDRRFFFSLLLFNILAYFFDIYLHQTKRNVHQFTQSSSSQVKTPATTAAASPPAPPPAAPAPAAAVSPTPPPPPPAGGATVSDARYEHSHTNSNAHMHALTSSRGYKHLGVGSGCV